MNDPNKTLSLATRIKKPVPLAALAVLVLAIVALALVKAGAREVGALGYTIIGTVGFVALIALILALTGSKPPQRTIKTTGDFSPGEVVGDYSVGSVESPRRIKSMKRDGAVAPPPASIETQGANSPGRVGGDYTAQKDTPPK